MGEKVPLSPTFMVVSIIGFIASAIYTYSGSLNLTWGFTFMLIFLIMLIASLVSVSPNEKEFK